MIVNGIIFIAGLLVYAGYGLPGFLYLLGATALSYGAGLLIPKRKWIFWVVTAANAAMLLLVKLQPVTGMALPAVLGISYFTLKIIAYLADIYRGVEAPEKNIFRYALFVTYLPQVFLGPIQRYSNLAPALFENRRITQEGIWSGLARLAWGGFKKLVIASRAGVIVSAISAKPDTYSGPFALAAMLLYSVQLYADFSGGIDMVLGVSRILGIRLEENFDAPYFSQSFQEFWRRWHMTLGSWLRQYVYIPLGGNRKGKVRKILNLIVTFLVSGIWHGVEYLLWGLFNGIFVAFGTKLQTKWKLLNQTVTFLLVSLLWSFFVWPTALQAGQMVLSVFTDFSYGAFFAQIGNLGLTLGDWIVLGAATGLLWLYDLRRESVSLGYSKMNPAAKTAVLCALGMLILVFGMYGIGFNADAFIYSRF